MDNSKSNLISNSSRQNSSSKSCLKYWLEQLEELVLINTASENIPSVHKVLGRVEAHLVELGLSTRRIRNGKRELLIGESTWNCEKYISLICHVDTVCHPLKAPRFSITGDYAYGPGVIDNKGGVIVGLWALNSLLSDIEPGDKKLGIRFVCSPCEELGSVEFHDSYRGLAVDSLYALGLEPAAEGNIITSRKGNRWYDIEFLGKSAHSGRAHKEGINACVIMANAITELSVLTNYSKDQTVNIGKVSGGMRHNIVSENAFIQFETRFPCHKSMSEINYQAEMIIENYGTFEIVDNCPPMAESDLGLKLFKEYKKIITKLENRTIRNVQVGGAADANHFSRPDNVVIDGLGPIGDGMHTANEKIYIPSLETRSMALSSLIKNILLKGGKNERRDLH